MLMQENVTYQQTYQAMEAVQQKGLTRSIGMCNIGTSMVRQVLAYATVKPAVLQVEIHPYNTQEILIKYCKQQGIAVMAFSNLGSAAYVGIGRAVEAEAPMLRPEVTAIASAVGKTPAQVLLRFAVQRGTTCIPKSNSLDRVRENFALLDFTLNDEQMASILSMNMDRRFNNPDVMCEEIFGYFCPVYA